MKKIVLFTTLTLTSGALFAQTQIGNGDMEIWEDLGAATESPTNWSGIKEASGNGLFISFAPQAITQSTDTPSGTGFSAQLQAHSVLGTIANGTMTCGQLNVGSTTAADPSNYAWSDTGGTEFSEACTDMPDSIVFWTKFSPGNASHNGRMKATLHDSYDYQDPEDAASSTHVVAIAVLNYPETNGWERKAVAFDYSGPASNNTYILVTFTTNELPGVGTDLDINLIDDVQLIYNSNGIEENENFAVSVFMNNDMNELNFSSNEMVDGTYSVYNMAGAMVKSGSIEQTVPFNATIGVYIVHVKVGESVKQFKVFKN